MLITRLCGLLAGTISNYALVCAEAKLAKNSKKPWASSLINSYLRNSIHQPSTLMKQMELFPDAKFSHPKWWIDNLSQYWPSDWQSLIAANHCWVPMSLRIIENTIQTDPRQAQLVQANIGSAQLDALFACLKWTKPDATIELPGLELDLCRVQNTGSQLAAELLMPQSGDSVLDGRATPGDKAVQRQEGGANQLKLVCPELDKKRPQSLPETLHRLQLTANYRHAHALTPEEWWSARYFDCILLDAPCFGSGGIRRHRGINDIRCAMERDNFTHRQKPLLASVWPLLKRGGHLLDCTCALIHKKGETLITALLARCRNTQIVRTQIEFWGVKQDIGHYILHAELGMDKFY